jgi:hypothetical protein
LVRGGAVAGYSVLKSSAIQDDEVAITKNLKLPRCIPGPISLGPVAILFEVAKL